MIDAIITWVSYHIVKGLGFLGILVLFAVAWSFGLNYVYKQLKSTHHFFEYFRYRKEFLPWLKQKHKRRR